MHSTKSFSMNGKEGRGDTSVWTDTPLDRAQKAQQRYAYWFFFLELRRRALCHFTIREKRVQEQGENSPPKNTRHANPVVYKPRATD